MAEPCNFKMTQELITILRYVIDRKNQINDMDMSVEKRIRLDEISRLQSIIRSSQRSSQGE